MKTIESFRDNLFSVNNDNFNDFALELFYFQAQNNEIYRSYIELLGLNVSSVKSIDNIPFLPIEFFKHFEVKTGSWEAKITFESSGTTASETSKHYVRDPDLYLRNSERVFKEFYGPIDNYHILALLPSYLERGNSSLVYMVDHFIKKSGSAFSGFYLNEFDRLHDQLQKLKHDTRKTILFGVTFGLIDFCQRYSTKMEDLIVVETGGMKGRRKEMTREEVHAHIKRGFSVEIVHSEYGMTELLSQAYSKGDGKFRCPSTMKILTREINDPFTLKNDQKTGAINIIDLANIETCTFIETRDLGTINDDGTFEVLGRFDNSELRGCNLMAI